METFTELDQLVEGLTVIDEMCDKVMIKLQGNRAVKHVPVVIIGKEGHSCGDPENCKLNTTDSPYWCMIANDRSK